MSTKNSIYFDSQQGKEIHVYEDFTDPDVIYVRKQQVVEFESKFSKEEMFSIARSLDLAEMERQSKISDDILSKFVTKQVMERATVNKNNLFAELHATGIYGDSELPIDQQIQNGLAYFQKIRDAIKELFDSVMSKKVYKIEFGLEMIES